MYRWLADVVLLAHLAFLLFVVLGGLLVWKWPQLAWIHVPAAAWGVAIELTGRICPLTPLENALRRLGGEAGYGGGFIEHYVTAALYPSGLTRAIQVGLGVFALTFNVLVYWRLVARRRITPPR